MGVKHLAVLAAVGAVVLTGRSVRADPKGQPERPKAEQRADAGLRETRGRIKDVDRGKNQMVVQAKDKPLTLQLDKTTTIFIEGRVGTLEEVDPGSEVRASYELKAGANRAQWVEVSKPDEPKARQTKETLPETPPVQNPTVPPAPTPPTK